MRMVIDWEDDTVLVEGRRINLGTTESGIYIMPLENDEEVFDKEDNRTTKYHEEEDWYLNLAEKSKEEEEYNDEFDEEGEYDEEQYEGEEYDIN